MATAEKAREIAQHALGLNSKQQDALRTRLSALEERLAAIDKLINDVDATPDSELPLEDVATQEQVVVIPGAFKPVGMLLPSQISAVNSPFYEDCMKRDRYLGYTLPPSMSNKEQASLQKHILIENKRLWAINQAQLGNSDPLTSITGISDEDFLVNADGLDWGRIATAVSQECNITRTSTVCRLRWMNDLHPRINHKEWSEPERAKLKEIVESRHEGLVDWEEVSKLHGNGRTPIQCVKQCINPTAYTWTSEGDKKLLDAVLRYGDNNWNLVALATSPTVSGVQCATRYSQLTDERVYASGPWTPAEDDLLRRAVARCGETSFYAVSQFVRTRSRQQCRDRWENGLPSQIVNSEEWAPEEDERLLQVCKILQDEHGEVEWISASLMLGGKRNDDSCRERYTFLTKSKATKPKPKPRGKRHKEGRDKVGDVMVQALDKDLPGLPVEEPPSVAPSRPRPRPRARRVSEVRETTVDEVGDQSPKEHSAAGASTLTKGSSNRAAKSQQNPDAMNEDDGYEIDTTTSTMEVVDPNLNQQLRRSTRFKKSQ